MKSNKAFTIIELMVVIGIIVILLAFLLPGLRSALNKGKQLNCISQMKQLHIAVGFYSQTYGGFYPYIDNSQPDNAFVGFRAALGKFIDVSKDDIFKCTNPSSEAATDSYYFYNNLFDDDFPTNPDKVSELTGTPVSGVYLFSCRSGYRGGAAADFYPHSHGVNVIYADGHAVWEKK